MENEDTYIEAIAIAAKTAKRFRDAHAHCAEMQSDLQAKYFDMFVRPLATETCSQEALIADLFGVSPDRVSADVDRLVSGEGGAR